MRRSSPAAHRASATPPATARQPVAKVAIFDLNEEVCTAAARDLAQHRIRVITIASGIFLTPVMKGWPQPAQDSLGAQVPHPSRLSRHEEYAQLVEAIVTNPMLNGEVIRLDSSIRMAPR